MTIKNSLRCEVDHKVWEPCTPAPFATVAGSHTICDPSGEDRGTLLMINAATVLRYDHKHDAWTLMPASGAAGTFGAGSCGTYHPHGPKGAVRATGTTTTVPTSLTINWQLNYKIRFTAGPNAGLERRIIGNTLGANSTLTLDSPLPTACTTATSFVILSGKFYFFNAGAKGFAAYDRALNTWTQLSVAGTLPGTWGTEGQLVATYMTDSNGFASGTATAGTTTTLTNTVKTWTAGEWVNYQVRFTTGANAGLVRVITASAANSLTFAALPAAVAAGDAYVIEGDEDKLLLLGNAAVTAYQYNITANTWETYSPATARAGAPGAGMTADWVFEVPHTDWTSELNVLNGRYVYSLRGGASAVLDRLDLVTKRWEVLTYVPAAETFTTGTGSDYARGYIYVNKEATGRVFRFNLVENRMVPWSTCVYPGSTAVAGDKLWTKVYTDPTTGETLEWVHMILHTSTVLMRCMVLPE